MKPYAHQTEALMRSRDAETYALLMEQGTGKSKVAIDTAVHLYSNGKIDCMVVVAPLGATVNWATLELPIHMPDNVNNLTLVYRSTKIKTQKWARKYQEWLQHTVGLRTFVINIDAVNTDIGYKALEKILRTFNTLLVIDESSRIKNPKAHRTKRMVKLGSLSRFRRIMTGTPLTQSPLDFYSQFVFLDEDIIGEPSAYSFMNEYAVLIDKDHGLMRHLVERKGIDPAHLPQVVAKDKRGKPIYKNLEKLAALVAPYAYRITKDECLDLPSKVYEKFYHELTAEQRPIYKRLEEELQIQLADDSIRTVNHLTALIRMQQLLSGNLEDMTVPTTRYDALQEIVEDISEERSIIIWCRFIAEIEHIQSMWPDDVVTYYGKTSDKQREAAVAEFQDGSKRIFVGQQQSGGVSLTLTRASYVIYFSNTFSLEQRLQSEDRAHRIGQEKSVTYIDIVCEGTVDEQIIDTLRAKSDLSIAVLRKLQNFQGLTPALA